jgi:hypothetical protein
MKNEELIAQLSADLPGGKPQSSMVRLALRWLLLALGYIAVLLLLTGVRGDWSRALQQMTFWLEVGALLAVILSTWSSVAVLGYPDLKQRRAFIYLPFVSLLLFGVSLILIALSPPAVIEPSAHSWRCCWEILLVGAAPALWVLFGLRQLASTHPRLAGWTLVLHGLAIGALWLRLAESTNSLSHVLIWHYLPMLLFSLGGLWLGRRMLRW